jgi:hypothetical protein
MAHDCRVKTLMLNVSVTNPCANHSCSEMCVLSAGGTPACLCSDGTVVEKGEACPSKVIGHFVLKRRCKLMQLVHFISIL